MLWQERIRFWTSRLGEAPAQVRGVARVVKSRFKPESASGVRRLQFFWVGCLVLGVLALSYGIVSFLSDKSPIQKQEETPKPTSIETATHKVDLNEALHYKIADEMKNLSEEVLELKERLALHDKGNQPSPIDSNNTDFPIPENINDTHIDDPRVQELETKILQLESQLDNQSSMGHPSPSQNTGEETKEQVIQKFSLGLVENPKHKQLKTVDTTIPAGAFAKTVLLSGLDASSAMNASSDPRPMLLRLIDPGTLPRRFQSDLKDCHCTASAFGDLSSERVYARLEKLTCIERATGEIIETQVAGYIAGSDGKAGIRGVVASKDGQFLGSKPYGRSFCRPQ